MPEHLKEDDYKNAARMLRCDVAAVKAVAEVESSGDGFLQDGKVKVLFEGHKFYKFTKGAFAQSHPTLCYPKWNRKFYAKGPNAEARGQGEWGRLQEAMQLNRKAALMSASFGKFQIMGFNYVHCGFSDVEEFFSKMQISEGEHLNAFCEYLKDIGLDNELREHRWSDFAYRYNGTDYWVNKYDVKLAAAWAKYSQ